MYLLSTGLCFHYLFYALLLKLLSDKYNFKKIIINSSAITFIVFLILFPNEFILSPNKDYIYLILFSLLLLFGAYIWHIIVQKNINMGQVDGLAIAMYLPLLTLISIMYFKQDLKITNVFGILLISVGAYFTLK
jgi:drug/metabolite transporter (DMT)-like permease